MYKCQTVVGVRSMNIKLTKASFNLQTLLICVLLQYSMDYWLNFFFKDHKFWIFSSNGGISQSDLSRLKKKLQMLFGCLILNVNEASNKIVWWIELLTTCVFILTTIFGFKFEREIRLYPNFIRNSFARICNINFTSRVGPSCLWKNSIIARYNRKENRSYQFMIYGGSISVIPIRYGIAPVGLHSEFVSDDVLFERESVFLLRTDSRRSVINIFTTAFPSAQECTRKCTPSFFYWKLYNKRF